MTTLVFANQTPSNINTLERNLAWSGLALAYINPTLGVLETEQRAEKVAQAAIFQAADNTYRLLIRACLPIDPAFINDRTKKSWMFVNEISNVALPAEFTVN